MYNIATSHALRTTVTRHRAPWCVEVGCDVHVVAGNKHHMYVLHVHLSNRNRLKLDLKSVVVSPLLGFWTTSPQVSCTSLLDRASSLLW